jgi:hypothetical protein
MQQMDNMNRRRTAPKGGVRAMPRVSPNFRRSDLQRAIRGAREEGLAIDRIEVSQDGGFTLHPKLEIANVEDTEAEDWITKHKSKTGTKRHANKR